MPQFDDYTDVSPLLLTDIIAFWRSGAIKNATISDIRSAVADSSRWGEIDVSKYTSTPAEPLKITMSDTSEVKIGMPIRLTQSGSFTYGIVDVVTSNTSINIRGENLLTNSISKMETGKPEQLFEVMLNVEGSYGVTARADLIAGIMFTGYAWKGEQAKLVQMSVYNSTVDSTSAPVVNALVNGNKTIQDGSPTGVAVLGSGTWSHSNFIDPLTNLITRNQPIELEVTAAGGTGDALNLSAHLVFILV